MSTRDKLTLTLGDKSVEFGLVKANEGHDGVDISKLTSELGVVTYDTGFVNTSNTKSAITFIDGEKGILRHRGYPIDQLASSKSFMETTYLLSHGELPNSSQLFTHVDEIRTYADLHPAVKSVIAAFPAHGHPMAMVSAAMSALSAVHTDSLDPRDEAQVERATRILLGQMPAIVAAALRAGDSKAPNSSDKSLGYVEDFLKLCFAEGSGYSVNPVVAKALDTLLLLHADHEQNCSTSTVRLVGSSQANLFASVASGVNALSGPAHGGANEAVLEMLEFIHASGDNVARYVERVKNKEDGIRLMGFGHRVYKSFDPRAKIVKATADRVLHELGVDDPLLDIAKELEAAALADSYFVERKLYPNVDFYTGVIYKAMGFPSRIFTPLFALGRLPGWIAHWREMNAEGTPKIGRPQQVYTGLPERSI